MESLVDVVICDSVDFDSVVYECWLDGIPPKTALSLKINGTRMTPSHRGINTGALGSPMSSQRSAVLVGTQEDLSRSTWVKNPQALDLLQSEIFDQYCTYDILGHYIRSPQLLSEQTMVILDDDAQGFVIQKYYELDDAVIREMLSRKLAKNRKDLDEVAEAVKLPLRRVTRYIFYFYDN